MSKADPPKPLRLSALNRNTPRDFELVPTAATLAALASELDLSALRKLRFAGTLHPEERGDWRLEGLLGATMIQPCGVTLEPVTTRVDVPVTRRYVQDVDPSDLPAEQEMPQDDSIEPLPDMLDLAALMAEELALAVPPFPRAADAGPGDLAVAQPGQRAMTDDDAKPFAGLRDALKAPKG